MKTAWKTDVFRTAGLAALLALASCGEDDLTLPSPSEIEGMYGSGAEVRLNGNVVDVRVEQEADQLRRGGPLWARVGPYIYLFSPQTRELLQRHDGVAAVRVRTVAPDGERIAEALLPRDTLTSVTWREATQRVAKARQEGTANPAYLEALVRFGEDYARFEYAERYRPG